MYLGAWAIASGPMAAARERVGEGVGREWEDSEGGSLAEDAER